MAVEAGAREQFELLNAQRPRQDGLEAGEAVKVIVE